VDPGALTVLDGGLSTALAARGHDLDHPLWTARLLLDDPDALVAAHLDFLRAGASVVTTSSYQASRAGLASFGLAAAGAADRALAATTALARRAVARHALDAPGPTPLVAASVGPFGAVLADGSEYTGRYPIGHDELVSFHAERLAVLVDSQPDLLAVETLPGADEATAVAEALARVAARPGTAPTPPAWVTFTCPSPAHTAAGDRIEDAARAAQQVPGLALVGVNCTAPSHVGSLLARLGSVTDLPLIAYPNSGQTWDPDGNRWLGEPDAAFAALDDWVALGARWIGGCCGVGPDGIAALARRVRSGR
jgi:homocysteine S-methyltransferase